MLKILTNAHEADMAQLACVYEESNRKAGLENSRSSDKNVQLLVGEQLFYEYALYFLEDPMSVYAVWTEQEKYYSALRLEPYLDGLLLNGLETHPDHRGKGYGRMLVTAVLQHLSSSGGCRVYSHIDQQNTRSISLHEACGFKKLSDHAVYLDGSYHDDSFTYVFNFVRT